VTTRNSVWKLERKGLRHAAAQLSCSALLAFIGVMSTGCGTWMNHRTGDCHVYGGVKRDWRDLGAQAAPESVAIVTALDLPLSAIGDTLCLPYDLAKDKDGE
jgi:uncharacterized protein YceK